MTHRNIDYSPEPWSIKYPDRLFDSKIQIISRGEVIFEIKNNTIGLKNAKRLVKCINSSQEIDDKLLDEVAADYDNVGSSKGVRIELKSSETESPANS